MGTSKKNKGIELTAKEYQQIAREIKALESKIKPLKEELLQFAKDNPESFDEAFQIKFQNGTYVGMRVSDVLEADAAVRDKLMANLDAEYLIVNLADKIIIDQAKKNNTFLKRLTKFGAGIGQKEVFAVYAG